MIAVPRRKRGSHAAAIANGAARPRDTAPSFFDRATEPVPTLARTTAWVNAWARWALDAVQIALDTPETYEPVAGALLPEFFDHLEALGDQVITGPTHTNVNDFRGILIR